MAAFKAKAAAKVLAERLKILVNGISIIETEDSNKWPILAITKGLEQAYVKIDDTGVGLRVDQVTGAPQRFYNPHKITVIKDTATLAVDVITVTSWDTGESVTPSHNGVAGAAVPFNTDNNTSVADLATEIAGFPGIISAVASGNQITVTTDPLNPVILSFSSSGGDGVVISQAYSANPDLSMRDIIMIQAALMGMLTLIYAKSSPTSFDLTGALLEARVKADPYTQGVSGSFQ